MGVPSQKPERRIAPLTFFMLLAPYAALAADPSRGAELYERKCTGCHSLDANRVGPAHRGVVGRKAGAAPDFAYSPALKKAGIVWTPDNLDKWLAAPSQFIKGSRMGFSVPDPQERQDIIAWLATQKSK